MPNPGCPSNFPASFSCSAANTQRPKSDPPLYHSRPHPLQAMYWDALGTLNMLTLKGGLLGHSDRVREAAKTQKMRFFNHPPHTYPGSVTNHEQQRRVKHTCEIDPTTLNMSLQTRGLKNKNWSQTRPKPVNTPEPWGVKDGLGGQVSGASRLWRRHQSSQGPPSSWPNLLPAHGERRTALHRHHNTTRGQVWSS